MANHRARGALLFTWLLAMARLHAQGAPGSAAEALAAFELHPDFEIELVAAEPLVFDPVDLEFDEHGTAYVLEFPGYPNPPAEEKDYPGKIVALEDTDGDGVYDVRRVYAEKFRMASSILPYRGGLLVASPPDLVFVRDGDGDGVAEERRVVLSGFSAANTQHNFNGLTHGLDNWIYGGNGGNSGNVYWAGDAAARTSIRGQDFRFDPASERFELIGRSSGGFEIALDSWGRFYSTHNMYHISQRVFPGRYVEANAYLRDSTLTEINDHRDKGLSRIFPLGFQATRVNHPEQSGYFSGSCGITHYGGGAFGPGFEGNVFVCDVVLNLIHRDVVRPEGTVMAASRGRERVEFLASSDRAFRPVNLTVGPEGALYVLDMHRDVIEHPEWIPDELERRMDLEAGKDQGRIYRITPKGGLPRARPEFSKENPEGAVAALAHENQWWRTTAQRLLVEWGDRRAEAPLRAMVRDSAVPLARAHALWTLRGLGADKDGDLLRGLRDPHPRVREQALIVAEPRMAESLELLEAAAELAEDPDSRVRMQAALTIGALADAENAHVAAVTRGTLEKIALRDFENRWTRLALLAGLEEQAAGMFGSIARGAPRQPVPVDQPNTLLPDGARTLLASLAEIVGARMNGEEIGLVLDVLERESSLARDRRFLISTLNGLADGAQGAPNVTIRTAIAERIEEPLDVLIKGADAELQRASWRAARAFGIAPNETQRRALARAEKIVRAENRPTDERIANLELLEFAPFEEREDVLFDLLDSRNPTRLQRAAVEQLARERSQEVARRLVAQWDSLGPQVRPPAMDVLLRNRRNHEILLDALESGDLLLGQFNFDLERRRTLLRWSTPEIGRRAKALFSDAGVVTRAEALEKMRGALDLEGDAERGRAHYDNLCVKCHTIGGEGGRVGPDLTDIFRKSAETLLHDVLDPNAAVDTEFISVTIVTEEGEIVNGIVVEESETSVTLRAAESGDHVIARAEIREMRSSGLSLMPEELEVGLSDGDMADLLAFLQEPR